MCETSSTAVQSNDPPTTFCVGGQQQSAHCCFFKCYPLHQTRNTKGTTNTKKNEFAQLFHVQTQQSPKLPLERHPLGAFSASTPVSQSPPPSTRLLPRTPTLSQKQRSLPSSATRQNKQPVNLQTAERDRYNPHEIRQGIHQHHTTSPPPAIAQREHASLFP